MISASDVLKCTGTALSRTPSLKVGVEFDEDEISSRSKDNDRDVQVTRGLVFDDDSSSDDDDASVLSIDSSSSSDDSDSEKTEGLAVETFDVDHQNSRLGRSRSVHFNLGTAGSPMRKSADHGMHSATRSDLGSGYLRTSWMRQRRPPMSKFTDGEQWLASATKLSAAGLRKRDVIHDDLFFVCFGEVCQTAIHSQLQQQRRRRACNDVSHAADRCGDRAGVAPQRTQSHSTPQELKLMPLQDSTGGDENAGERPASTATAWVPPHRRSRKVSFQAPG